MLSDRKEQSDTYKYYINIAFRRLISLRPELVLTPGWNSETIDNRRVSCDDFDKIPMLDLTPWTENADIRG